MTSAIGDRLAIIAAIARALLRRRLILSGKTR
jgi:hypothetical protein